MTGWPLGVAVRGLARRPQNYLLSMVPPSTQPHGAVDVRQTCWATVVFNRCSERLGGAGTAEGGQARLVHGKPPSFLFIGKPPVAARVEDGARGFSDSGDQEGPDLGIKDGSQPVQSGEPDCPEP